ncbi:MAG: hypothetical protein ACRD1Y_04510 [Terriglobales bacterium]
MPWLWPIIAIVILVLLYLSFDRGRYHGRGSDDARQRPTQEVFLDPTTGRRMRVYEDPSTGARSYREDP